MPDFVHIGDYKTGTTWLQQNVFGPDRRLTLLDAGDPGRAVYAALERISWRGTSDDIAHARVALGDADAQARAAHRLTGLSRESLIGRDFVGLSDWRRAAENLAAITGPTRIICVFREQYRCLDSLYSTYVKNGGRLSPRDLFMPEGDPSGMYRRIAYDEIASFYRDLFGGPNCLFLVYDQLRHDPTDFIKRIYDFIGLAPPTTAAMGERPNRRLSRTAAAIQRRFNCCVPSICHLDSKRSLAECLVGGIAASARPATMATWLARFTESGVPVAPDRIARGMTAIGAFRRMAELIPDIAQENAIFVPPEFVAATRERVAAVNRALERVHGLPISAYGWTC